MTKKVKTQVVEKVVEPMVETQEVKEMPSPTERLSDVDRLSLEAAKANKKAAQAQAEKALAQNETAELAYRYAVLQIYHRLGLSTSDAIDETTGNIIRGGAVNKG